MYTFLEKFLDDLKLEQNAVLENFSSALELEAAKWDKESKERAGRIIVQALDKARNLSGEQFDERTRLFCESIEKTLEKNLTPLKSFEKNTWRIAVANMIAASFLAMTGLLIWL
ncbi:hypothetical protein [Desulfovibrio sp. SGI.169]|uniref:hypothetical protein n=1 Tax=Desulfovibrio sp. SGI.169 TaxID=3420561 RepID=UPI003D065D56